MLPKTHIIGGLIFSFTLMMIFPIDIGLIGALIIFFSSFLIDVDHYVYYVYKTRIFNLNKSIHWYSVNRKKFSNMTFQEKNKIYTGLCFLHGIEAFIVLSLLIFIRNPLSPYMVFVAIGFIFHHILDAIDLYIRNYRFDKVLSFFYSVKKAKNKKLLQEIKDD
ncbi:MAG: hypothetical protein Q8L27_02625 [archaeon]|nr:hypothetical protein [archaeon]